MIIDNAGTYTLRYTATDDCGKTTTVDRELVVDYPKRTVIYTDGTFIINERLIDSQANTALHGEPLYVYDPFDPNGDTDVEKYIFASTSDRPWHTTRDSIKSVEFGSNVKPTSTRNWFSFCTLIESFNLNGLDTSETTDFNAMFNHCDALTNLDVTSLDTSKATNLGSMFGNCKLLSSIDVSNFNTSNVDYFASMFTSCESLTSIDVSNFDTSKATNVSSMFARCKSLTAIDISNFDTSNVTSFVQLFFNCENLASVNLGCLDTRKVTQMTNMFRNTKLETIDLSCFDTSATTKMGSMFSENTSLKTIYASPTFVVSQLTEGTTNMFQQMSTNLVGGAGTQWSSTNIGSAYAHIDGGTSNPGYFTAKS